MWCSECTHTRVDGWGAGYLRIRERLLRRSPFRRVRIGALTHAVSLCVCVCACACACVMWAYRLIQNVASIIDIETLQSWSLQGTKRLVLGGLGQDCHTACASAGLSCSDAAFPYRVLNQDLNMVRALFRAVGLQCSGGIYEDLSESRPSAYYLYNYDSFGAQTLQHIACHYGYRVVTPGSTVSNIIPKCSSYPYINKRLCPCGRY